MDRQQLINDLRSLNHTYGAHANKAFEEGDYEQGMKLGGYADAAGEAAEALKNGATVEQVNERHNGICDF